MGPPTPQRQKLPSIDPPASRAWSSMGKQCGLGPGASGPSTWWPLDTPVDVGRKLWSLSRVATKLRPWGTICRSHVAV